MARKKLTKEQVTLLLPLTHDMCAMHDIAPTCENYRLVQGDHFFGEFAHICAAEEGGERYVEGMDDTVRNSVQNTIVLCPNHHTIVDKKDNGYTAERLHQIKAQHEGHRSLQPLEASEAVIDEAVAVANINITNVNTNSGDGVQQVSTVTGSAPQSNFSAARDVYIINNVPVPLPAAIVAVRPPSGFHQPDRTLTMKIETTWLRMSDNQDIPGSGFDAEYLLFTLGDKQFAILAQELAEQTAGINQDGVGKYDMGAAAVVLILDRARQASASGLQEHTLLHEVRALSHEKSLRLVINSNDADVRHIPFEKIDEASAGCTNPIKLMFMGSFL